MWCYYRKKIPKGNRSKMDKDVPVARRSKQLKQKEMKNLPSLDKKTSQALHQALGILSIIQNMEGMILSLLFNQLHLSFPPTLHQLILFSDTHKQTTTSKSCQAWSSFNNWIYHWIINSTRSGWM
ncbi:hypothetical protein MANES_15G026201v8 [Manihot esculenta]|uniref:Uncharacterized protein n=1 Tax=Manihot esculenta TaxID=3983 RepID=A0ACB7GDA7_MANES|nr:hypothetical protein MANES_15G026201v8 [Manihot esculenta]